MRVVDFVGWFDGVGNIDMVMCARLVAISRAPNLVSSEESHLWLRHPVDPSKQLTRVPFNNLMPQRPCDLGHPDQSCSPFHNSRSGFVILRGEGRRLTNPNFRHSFSLIKVDPAFPGLYTFK
jgi:hypothetical protein